MDAIPHEVAIYLDRVLYQSAHQRWWTSPVPAFGGLTPEQMWKQEPDAVVHHAKAYLDPSYS